MSLEALESEFNALFRAYPFIRVMCDCFFGSLYSVEMTSDCQIPCEVLASFFRILRKYGFSSCKMSVEVKFFENHSKTIFQGSKNIQFSVEEAKAALEYKPKKWQRVVWTTQCIA